MNYTWKHCKNAKKKLITKITLKQSHKNIKTREVAWRLVSMAELSYPLYFTNGKNILYVRVLYDLELNCINNCMFSKNCHHSNVVLRSHLNIKWLIKMSKFLIILNIETVSIIYSNWKMIPILLLMTGVSAAR